MTAPRINTARLRLRAPGSADLERCALLLGDYEVAKMLSRVPYPYDMEAGKAFLSCAAENWKSWPRSAEANFLIDCGGEMIGGISFKALHETPEIGYWLGRAYWGQGYIGEAIGAAIEWFFAATDHEILLGMAMEENERSINAMIKCGFEQVGRSASMSLARGDYVPDVVMKLTREAFTARNAA
ncbi:N-acetyltransferase [Roseibium aquae]|uniref:N-acetyltransferase n=1 Tax=Roseibium aquae TaxID=1323746 RepID=A0A916TI20_9HYPH|nr:GNAT family N-acetyltransferase [Roseibium aquae]GGB46523.1 N-acetyltransferase [Roseibium aquae]